MEIYQMTAHELSDKLKAKEISSVEATRAVLDRVDAVEEKVGGYVTVLREEAIKAAEEIDKKRQAGEALGDLAGVPVAIKDNICTEGVKTTCASKMLYNFVPPYSATAAVKMAEAGTVLIGKANMDEFAMGSSTENSAEKITRNPFNTDHVPGGSSGGSAAVVSADEAFVALGSDTGGSIRQPASFCGVVGMKPTYGMVSRFGLVAFASSLDQIGPLSKDVTDCALTLNAIVGHDKMDSTSLNVEVPNYKDALVNDVKGLKIGVPEEYYGPGISDEVKAAVQKALKDLESMGAIVEPCSLPRTEYALPAYYIISSAEASSNLARYDGVKYGFRAEKFEDLIDLYRESRSQGFGDEVKRRIMLGTYALSSGYYDAYYKKAQQVRTLIKQDFDKVFEKYDVLMTPTSPTTAWKIGAMNQNPLEMYAADICTVSINIAGLPGLVVPCGLDSQGLPIGLQMIGKPFGESTLLRAGYTFEQNTTHHNNKANL